MDTSSHPTAADGNIHNLIFNADVSVIQAGGGEFKLLHTANFKDDADATRHSSSVAISPGRLFVHTDTTLFASGK